jgi:cell division septum initiation protein DivIVA
MSEQPNKQYHQALTANRKLLEDNARLQAQVERLTKAGDELWEFAKLADTNAPKARRKALKDWFAVKEGKQSK